ncbi:MAG: hypothetical protein M2R45_01069 [Verrucomicrobia subdivision 3 bacterium]|nr:hypothetical protein [Limisphaerales bacterium]MCS1414179.1 hypothetical protein [Limisphaerales bacterium]
MMRKCLAKGQSPRGGSSLKLVKAIADLVLRRCKRGQIMKLP